MRVVLFLPTLNEIVGLKAVMPRIPPGCVDEIVFLDGNSTDGTVEYIRENGWTLFLEKPGEGLLARIVEIFDRIEADVIIGFSPDGNCVPELIPKLVEKMKEGYDMVIASRYLPPAVSEDDTPVTRFGNWLFTTMVNVCHGGRYTDVMNIYRAYRKNLVKELDLDKPETYRTPERIFCCRIGWEMIMAVRAAKRRLKVAEIPGDEPARIGGTSKLKVVRWGSAYMYQLIRDIFWWK